MELFISADYGKTWYFVRRLISGEGFEASTPYFKAGYTVRVLSPLDQDFSEFYSQAVFPSP